MKRAILRIPAHYHPSSTSNSYAGIGRQRVAGRNLDVKTNDVKLNLELLKRYFQVRTLDQTLERHRNEFRTRSEHLQKRQEALQERERLFKEKILR